jgi:hypothetical protein
VGTLSLQQADMADLSSVGLTSVFRIVFTYNPTKMGKRSGPSWITPTNFGQVPSLTASSGSGCSWPQPSFARVSQHSGLYCQPNSSLVRCHQPSGRFWDQRPPSPTSALHTRKALFESLLG